MGLDSFNEMSELPGSRFADCPLGRAVQETSGEMHTEVQDAPLKGSGSIFDMGEDGRMEEPLKQERGGSIFDMGEDDRMEDPRKQEGLENIKDAIYNRDEDEFTFDELNLDDARLERYLRYFEPETWERMDMEDKENVVRAFEGYLTEVLDLKRIPNIKYYYNASKNDCGAYNPANNTILINKNLMDNPREVVNTVAHEAWHAYQHQRAKRPVTRKDAFYVVNFENYIRPKLVDGKWVGFEEYESQLVEAEARAFGKLFVERGS